MCSGKKFAVTLGILAALAVISGTAALRITHSQQSAAASTREGDGRIVSQVALRACGELVGIRNLSEDNSTLGAGSSLQEMAETWEAKGCVTELREIPDDMPGLAFPTWIKTDNGWCVLVASSERLGEICIVRDTVEWREWRDFAGSLASDSKVLVVSHARDVTLPPRLTVFDDEIDLGTSRNGPKIKRTITLFNTGDEAIEIASQTFSCGCTTATLAQKSIEARGYCRAEISMDLGDAQIRQVDWSLSCVPADASKVIPLSGRAGPSVRLEPDYFALGKVTPSASSLDVQTLITCTSHTDHEMSVEPVYLSDGVSVSEVNRTSEGVLVDLDIRALEAQRTQDGQFSIEVILAVEGCGPERQLFSVQGSGEIVPEIRVDPKLVNLGIIDTDEHGVYRTKLRFETKRRGAISVNVAHPEFVSAHVKGKEITVEVKPQSSPGLFKTGILLMVGQDSVHIPIRGVVKGGNE